MRNPLMFLLQQVDLYSYSVLNGWVSLGEEDQVCCTHLYRKMPSIMQWKFCISAELLSSNPCNIQLFNWMSYEITLPPSLSQ